MRQEALGHCRGRSYIVPVIGTRKAQRRTVGRHNGLALAVGSGVVAALVAANAELVVYRTAPTPGMSNAHFAIARKGRFIWRFVSVTAGRRYLAASVARSEAWVARSSSHS